MVARPGAAQGQGGRTPSPVRNMSPINVRRITSSVYPEDEIAAVRNTIMPLPPIPAKYREEFEGKNEKGWERLENKVYKKPGQENGFCGGQSQRGTYYGILSEYGAK